MTKVIMNDELFQQLEAVQKTGETNMLDKWVVQRIANELELSELVRAYAL